MFELAIDEFQLCFVFDALDVRNLKALHEINIEAAKAQKEQEACNPKTNLAGTRRRFHPSGAYQGRQDEDNDAGPKATPICNEDNCWEKGDEGKPQE